MPRYLLIVLLLLHLRLTATQTFTDVSKSVGIDHRMGRRKKYGGPTVVDLNSDGHPDLIFCHHDKFFIEVYINTGNGKFNKIPFSTWRDAHAITPFRPSSYTKHMRFTISGGGSAGTRPANPEMFEYRFDTGTIVDVTRASGIDAAGGRGRSAVFLTLKGSQHFRPDVIFTNARVIPGFEPQQFGYQNIGKGKFKLKFLKGFADTTNNWIAVTDIDNDGIMEVISYIDLKFYKITNPFTLKDITSDVLPAGLQNLRGVVAVAEFDYDNDGDMDLYICRTNTGSMSWLRGAYFDYLLENRGGKYVDVSNRARIPKDSTTRAVTAADFNNDGRIDLFITRYQKRDLLLLNNGDGTFKSVFGLIPRPPNVRGDSAQAVDYNSDGRVDLVIGQGDRDKEAFGGFYRVFKNGLTLDDNRRYILVRVGSSPRRAATSLHAVVTVSEGEFKNVRRVGSPGTSVSNSYIELVHVGIGWRPTVDVHVRWTNGESLFRANVSSGSKIVMGVV